MYEKFTDRGTNANLILELSIHIVEASWCSAGRVLGGEPRPGAVIQPVLGRQAGSQHRPHRPAHRHLPPVTAHTLVVACHVTCSASRVTCPLQVWAVTCLVWVAVVVVLLVPLSAGQPLHSVMSCHVMSCHVMSPAAGEAGHTPARWGRCPGSPILRLSQTEIGCRGRVQSREYLMVNAEHTIQYTGDDAMAMQHPTQKVEHILCFKYRIEKYFDYNFPWHRY